LEEGRLEVAVMEHLQLLGITKRQNELGLRMRSLEKGLSKKWEGRIMTNPSSCILKLP
jgi:hypothetical protein